uniref:rho GTPase-activating protein 30 isoform X2 n=1 Tax=Scatophagus argus TaxID=75038 RepID=UPI001ED82799|nr:rho GTPase-activating protein 30 isoform X2 [Scatophagus argus]
MRRVRRKGGNKEKVFGCDLLDHLNASSQEIPQVLRCCSEFVETHGIVDGIYRLSGVSSNIQKLRGEFESDGSPDLNKDVYLQDIHCVSSLCKAYFRELPNPLLTYQLYDKFAEAVAIQLEEERLVKIRDVLKELPRPHYRTLEFLMRHLVRMASHSSETNMHARNLAIVWAPNLLRSKDIEASGFNGRAAFMEVRVQSIVVEFILTHVPQLFPEQGLLSERRKSLPSPTAASCQEEGFFKSVPAQPVPNFGNISPGDGPLPIRPYHAIIEGTDKRKGSLKGRKWMSIFNIGGRFHDPRRRQKHSAKEKDGPVLRPARSMDSLSSPSYPNEGSRRAGQHPPSTNPSTTSPLITSSPKPGSEASTGAIGGSEYAVTYRRGTGLVSGGTQGTYTALDPEGLGLASNENLQSRSPGLSTKAGRRAAMHITGPTLVTVPLHITSNLALGVLQGGGGDRVIHRGKDKEGDRVEGKEEGEKAERRESRVVERKVEDDRKAEEKENNHNGKVADGEEVMDAEGNSGAGGDNEGKKEEEEEEDRVQRRWKKMGGRSVSREQRAKSLTSNTEEDEVKDGDENSEYMDMKGMNPTDFQPEVNEYVFDASDVLNSTEVEQDDLGLSGYVEDNFEFLDHMDCNASYQVKEFSVEPPGHSDDEYELMEQNQSSSPPAEPQRQQQLDPEAHSPAELKPHRPLSLDIQNRHTKSLSLPYMTSPVHGPDESSSEDEAAGDVSYDHDYSSEDDECMFVKSLPPDFFLNDHERFEPDVEPDCCDLDGVPVDRLQISEEREHQSPNTEFPAHKESNDEDQEWERKDEEDEDEEKELTKMDEVVHQEGDHPENNWQSKVTEEDHTDQHLTSEASTHCSDDFPPPGGDESDSCVVQKETVADATSEESGDPTVGAAEQPRTSAREDTNERDSDEGEDKTVCKEVEDTCQETVLEIKEDDEGMWGETTEEGNEVRADKKHEEKMQEGDKEQDIVICRTNSEIWDELEDVVCKVIEEEESKQAEKTSGGQSVAEEGDKVEDVAAGKQEEHIARVSGEKTVEVDEAGTNQREVSVEAAEAKLKDTQMQQEFEEKETSELDEAIQGKHVVNDEAQHHDREEVIPNEQEKNDKEGAEDQRRTQPSVDLIRADMKVLNEGRKCETSDCSHGGVGRKLVTSRHPKVHQVKAVPVVPPKPQHCKITALTLRQQQQQRERRDADRERENSLKVQTERDKDEEDGDDGRGERDKPTLRGGERERERRRDGDESAAMRDTSRNSPISMCFDEAVAIATMRREKEKECEKERQRERGNEAQ